MEFLITILLMLVPLVFKGIEKGLTKAAPQQSASSAMGDEFDEEENQNAQAQDEELETIRRTLKEVFPEVGLPDDVVSADNNKGEVLVDKAPVEYIPASKLIEIQPIKKIEKDAIVNNCVESDICNKDIQNSNKKEKIDAKKLIIYSEIMKPKY